MSDLEEVYPVATTVLGSLKRIFALLKAKQYMPAAKEVINFGKVTYVNHMKGKYVTVKGKQIPMTLVVIVAVLGLYIISTSCGSDEVEKVAVTTTASKEVNTFEQNGIKIHDMRKCDQAACGVLENTSNDAVARIVIPVNFHNEAGQVVYEGGVEATDVASMTRMKLNIPSEVPFAYFSLGDVQMEK